MTETNNIPNHSEIRSDQAATALRIGFSIRLLQHELSEMWTATLMKTPDVDNTIETLDHLLLSISHRMNEFESVNYESIRKAIVTSLSVSRDYRNAWVSLNPLLSRDELRQRITEDLLVISVQNLQKKHLAELRTILRNVVSNDLRLMAWFEIGDQLGNLIYQLVRGDVPLPKPSQELTDVKIALLKLPPTLRKRVEIFLPHPREYRSEIHLASELSETYRGLCGLVEQLTPIEIPFWDGRSTIRFRVKTHSFRLQKRMVIPRILDLFQSRGWPPYITLPSDFEGDVKQAIYNINGKTNVIRLSQSGDQVFWHPPLEPQQS